MTSTEADQILKGNYDPNDYSGGIDWEEPEAMAAQLQAAISADSLKKYIIQLSTFGNRNTGSDTLSATYGMGAARRWVFEKYEQWATESNGRLVTSYFQFDEPVCGMNRHKNILAILPGTDAQNHGIVLIEGHLDSRCTGECDLNCPADGIEDNASGTALTMELARVFSRFSFKNTLVFMVTTGEEQGLIGADAFADYIQNNDLPLRAVQNNDVIGGVLCGETSSPPSCPGLGHIDSMGVRLFGAGGRPKQLYRYIKLQYLENLEPIASVKMDLRLMAPEDRSGRGGDHIPFRQKGYAAMRFTSANEHGNANVSNANYHDRQHTSDDILGMDTDNDGVVDSFFVDFNYLARNAAINANSAAMIAKNVPAPELASAYRSNGQVYVTIADSANLGTYRVMVRTLSNDWDSVFTTDQLNGAFPCAPTGPLYVSVAAVDAYGVESLFSTEKFIILNSTEEQSSENQHPAVQLLQNRPNPFDEATWIGFYVNQMPKKSNAEIRVTDAQGKVQSVLNIEDLKIGLNEVLFQHGYHHTGVYTYTLFIGGQMIESKQMVFAN